CALIHELRSDLELKVVCQRPELLHLTEEGVEGVDAVLLGNPEAEPALGFESHVEHRNAVVTSPRTRYVRHGDELLGVAQLDLRQVAGEVLGRAKLSRKGQALESIRSHPVVEAVDEGAPHELPVPLEEGVLLVAERGEGLAEDVVGLWARSEKETAVLVRRSVYGRRAVVRRPELEAVEEPPGSVREPTARGPCLPLDRGRRLQVAVVCPEPQRKGRVGQEGGKTRPSVPDPGPRPLEQGPRLVEVVLG